MNCYYIIGLRVNHRTGNAVKLQEVLTQFGCNIKLRVGLHETSEQFCSDDGIILLQVCGEQQTIENMLTSFNEVEGVKAKMLVLD